MEQIRDAIKSFISENFLFTSNPSDLLDDTSFMEKGIVDSTGVLEIVSFLEEKFGIQVNDNEVEPDNLDSVTKLVAYVARKNGRLVGM